MADVPDPPAAINDTPQAAREGLHAMVTMPGASRRAWLDDRGGKGAFVRAFGDAGRTWSRNVLLYERPREPSASAVIRRWLPWGTASLR
jgi:hypothetical protein